MELNNYRANGNGVPLNGPREAGGWWVTKQGAMEYETLSRWTLGAPPSLRRRCALWALCTLKSGSFAANALREGLL